MRSPTPKYSYHKWRNDHGGALVEFAIVLPLLLILVFGIIEFSLLFHNKAILSDASREAARRGIVQSYDESPAYPTESDIRDFVNEYLFPDNKSRLISFGTNFDKDNGTIVKWYDKDGNEIDEKDVSSGDKLVVTVEYNYKFLVISNLISLTGIADGKIKLQGTTSMRLL